MSELWQLLHWPHHSGRRHFISTLVKEMPQKLHEQLTHSSWLLLTLRIPLNWAHEEQSITVSETRRLPVFQLVPTGLLQAMANHQEAIVYSWPCWPLEFPMSRMLPPLITEKHLLCFVYNIKEYITLFLKKAVVIWCMIHLHKIPQMATLLKWRTEQRLICERGQCAQGGVKIQYMHCMNMSKTRKTWRGSVSALLLSGYCDPALGKGLNWECRKCTGCSPTNPPLLSLPVPSLSLLPSIISSQLHFFKALVPSVCMCLGLSIGERRLSLTAHIPVENWLSVVKAET